MGNKDIAKQFIDNLFADNDKAYEVVAENVRVNWPGFDMEEINGKENLKNFFEKYGPDKVIEQKIHNLVAEGDLVIGDGTIVTERNGKREISHFADIYTIENGKITALNSYMIVENAYTK